MPHNYNMFKYDIENSNLLYKSEQNPFSPVEFVFEFLHSLSKVKISFKTGYCSILQIQEKPEIVFLMSNYYFYVHPDWHRKGRELSDNLMLSFEELKKYSSCLINSTVTIYKDEFPLFKYQFEKIVSVEKSYPHIEIVCKLPTKENYE